MCAKDWVICRVEGPAGGEAASHVEGSQGETMMRAKVVAGAVAAGVMMMSGLGCQQAPAPAPTVVVEHHDDGHDRNHPPPPPPPDRRDQSQQDRDRKNPPPQPRQPE